MPYLLDADTCIYFINRAPGYEQALERLQRVGYGEVMVSAVTLAELEVGIIKKSRPNRQRVLVEHFLFRFEIVPFDAEAARIYGSTRAWMERRGRVIGELDLLIAAQALARGLIVVTNNTREFQRVPGLKLESWFPHKS